MGDQIVPPAPRAVIKCPYCQLFFRGNVFNRHLRNCRRTRGRIQPMWTCPYNSSHSMPIAERSYHLITCNDRFDVSFYDKQDPVQNVQNIEVDVAPDIIDQAIPNPPIGQEASQNFNG